MVVNRKTLNILDQWNGCPEIFSLSWAFEISREYLLLFWTFRVPVTFSMWMNSWNVTTQIKLALDSVSLGIVNILYFCCWYFSKQN